MPSVLKESIVSAPRTLPNAHRRTTCRCCGGERIVTVMDFGDMPLAGGFLRQEDIAREQKYPLDLVFCERCTLLQVPVVIAPEVLFKDYFYFSSAIGTLVEHCAAWARETYEMYLKDRREPSVFEIGCNDGVMLKPFALLGVRAVGVDPASNVVASVAQDGFTIIDAFFDDDVAARVETEHGLFDVIVSSYSFAHIDNMASVLKGVKRLLKLDGVFQCEVYYVGTTLEEMQYDMIYHEHCNYYSLSALEHFFGTVNMEVFDVHFTPGVRSGAVRFSARHRGGRSEPVSARVGEMRDDEARKGYANRETFEAYGGMIAQTKRGLLTVLDDLKAQGKSIIGYGASGRGTMVMNYCGIDGRYLDYVVDDAPAKHGFYTPGMHVKIEPWSRVEEGPMPDYALLFAWSFKKEVLAKRQEYVARGGRFIVPLPTVSIEP